VTRRERGRPIEEALDDGRSARSADAHHADAAAAERRGDCGNRVVSAEQIRRLFGAVADPTLFR
jgi:hypothetical protein